MATATKSARADGKEYSYGKESGQGKRKWGGGGKEKEIKEETGRDKSREKRKYFKFQSTQHLARACLKK